MQASYQTVFEMGFRTFPWGRVAHPLVFVAIGLVLGALLKRKPGYRLFMFSMALFAALFVVLGLVNFIPRFIALRSTYVSGKSSIVEGVVENLHPAPTIGPANESFSVSGIQFSYSALDDTPYFHDAPSHETPIREGSHVRIHYNGDCIQRVEVAR